MHYYHNTEGIIRPTHEERQKLAYELYLRRGRQPGHELEDWLAAENRLCAYYYGERYGGSTAYSLPVTRDQT
jgi:hypothetical protein